MRFGIRDLMGLTAIVAIYAAGLGWLASEGLLMKEPGRLLVPMAMPLVLVAVFVVGKLLIDGNVIGRAIATFRNPVANRWHLGCLGFFVVMATVSYASQSRFPLPLLMMPLVFHVTQEAAGRVTFGDNGVVANGTASLWNDSDFRLDAPEGRLHVVPQPGARPGRWLAARSIRIPREHVEEVTAILFMKQGTHPSEPPTEDEAAG